ncbi:ATP-binding protein [Streptomyces sp. NPDC059637]|uniref:ATP-binding protein n=1 Tax=Streptomyces sp. NPDC059637 TaxID=3347752 RepID=UPI003678DF88
MPALVEEEVRERTVPGFYLRSGPSGFVLHVNASAQSLALVRELAAEVLVAAGAEGAAVDVVQLVVSELVGNAVRACGARAPLVVGVEVRPATVSVKVHDPDPDRLPRLAAPAEDDEVAESGRGLLLVENLALAWGTRMLPDGIGKTVWANVALRSRTATAPGEGC